MKSTSIILGLMFLFGPLFSQKNQAALTSNLNMSKSNINRIIYPATILTAANAQLLLADMEKANLPDEAAIKTWLAANFKRYGVVPEQVKQIFFFSGKQFKDCTICAKDCKGRCVQDPGSDCICVYTSAPNLRTAQPEQALTIIFFSSELMEEAPAMDLVANAFVSIAKSTTVKSSKSNSSD